MKLKTIINMNLKLAKHIKSLYLRKKLFLIVFFCFAMLLPDIVSAATNDSLTISRNNWRKTIGKKDYTETYFIPKVNNKFNFNPSFSWIKSDISRIIFTIIVISVLAFFLYLLLRNKVFNINKKIDNKELYQVLDENADINDLDLDSIYAKVMNENNYKLAIRIRFLMVLKILVSQEYLRWEKDKTNGDYVRELSKTDFNPDFMHLVMIFERIWFSDIEINASDFGILNPSFTNFISKLKKDEQ